MRIVTFIFVIAVVLIGITFAVLNAQTVSVNYYFGTRSLPLSMLLAIVFVVGVLVGALTTFFKYLRAKFSNMSLQRKVRAAEKKTS